MRTGNGPLLYDTEIAAMYQNHFAAGITLTVTPHFAKHGRLPPDPEGDTACREAALTPRQAVRAVRDEEWLRRSEAGESQRAIARAVGLSQRGVGYALLRARKRREEMQ